jgi:hypothetical protein
MNVSRSKVPTSVTSTMDGPTIVENYRDFEPPVGFRNSVETLLRYVPAKYLVGLKSIVLTNRAALDRNRRRQKTWSRKRKVRLAECRGSYSSEWKSSPATVWLYVDNIIKWETDRWWKRMPIVYYSSVGEVLYHEIGHHIHAVHRPIHDGGENVAEDWSRKLLAHFLRKHYWYLAPFLSVLAPVLSPLGKRLKRTK